MYNIKGGKENKREKKKDENLQKCFKNKNELFIGEVIVGVGEVVVVVMDKGRIKIDVNQRLSTLSIH
jgi:sorbitol-specific phosphotransferase system component IIBC